MSSAPCIDCKKRPKMLPAHRCGWCWLAKQPIEKQIAAAQSRLRKKQGQPDFVSRPRVPASAWPEGRRWCSGCQTMVPLEYARGSRCRACASQAAHASSTVSKYEITPMEYQELLDWQDGRCYVCGQVPRSRRLAIDHDHETGAVRGLLCANDDWGCNHTLARLLNDPAAAQRLVEYVTRTPLERMKAGEPPVRKARPPSILDQIRGR